jgi:hypothetical protein
MAKISIVRLGQTKNQYNSYSYRIVSGTPEPETNLYGDNQDIVYSNQKIGIWNRPIEVDQFIGISKSGKTYSAFSIDQELNSFTQRGHTATLAIKSGLDSEKVAMLKMLGELEEQELKVVIMKTQIKSLPAGNQPAAVNPAVIRKEYEEAEVIEPDDRVVN